MAQDKKYSLSINQLAMILDKIPAGITVIDQDARILYYNQYCSRFVDRKPEYIGRDIRLCHNESESIEKIDKILSELKEGHIEEFYYEGERNGVKLGVTILPFELNGEQFGFIQSFSLIR